MSDTTQKCQFVACFAPRTPTARNAYTVSMNFLHYAYTSPPAEFYETEPFFYVGTVDFPSCKVHITWQRSAANDLTPTTKSKVRKAVTEAVTNKAWQTNGFIDFQIQAHRREQEIQAARTQQESTENA